MGRLFLLFAIIPIAEIALLIRIGENIGTWNTLAIVIVTAMIGSYLAKREGFSILNKFQEKISTAQIPTNELVDGAIILVCGALLLTPGVITDVFGFLGLIPFTRAPIRSYLKRRFSKNIGVRSTGFQSPQSGPINETPSDPSPAGEDITQIVVEKANSKTD